MYALYTVTPTVRIEKNITQIEPHAMNARTDSADSTSGVIRGSIGGPVQ